MVTCQNEKDEDEAAAKDVDVNEIKINEKVATKIMIAIYMCIKNGMDMKIKIGMQDDDAIRCGYKFNNKDEVEI